MGDLHDGSDLDHEPGEDGITKECPICGIISWYSVKEDEWVEGMPPEGYVMTDGGWVKKW